MCETDAPRGTGWKGWAPPARSEWRGAAATAGPWHDLSHPLSAEVPRVPTFPAPAFERIMSLPDRPLNVTEMRMVVHIGTHVDSPRHFFEDGPAFEDIPLERLGGPGLVWPLEVAAATAITPAHLDGAAAQLVPGDVLILNTGFHAAAGTPRYDDHPYLSADAARWIVDHGVKLVAVDVPTPDMPVTHRGRDFDFPVHRILLSQGVLVAEHLTGLDVLGRGRVEVLSNPLNIVGGDGAPARIVARRLN